MQILEMLKAFSVNDEIDTEHFREAQCSYARLAQIVVDVIFTPKDKAVVARMLISYVCIHSPDFGRSCVVFGQRAAGYHKGIPAFVSDAGERQIKMGNYGDIYIAVDDILCLRGCGGAIENILDQWQLSGNGKPVHVQHRSL